VRRHAARGLPGSPTEVKSALRPSPVEANHAGRSSQRTRAPRSIDMRTREGGRLAIDY
jgi:hypothetical protein